jgi:hypothetical protein
VTQHTWIGRRVWIPRSVGKKTISNPLGVCCHDTECQCGALVLISDKLYVKVCWGSETNCSTKVALVEGLLFVDDDTPPTLAMLPCRVDPRVLEQCRLALQSVGVGFEPCALVGECNNHHRQLLHTVAVGNEEATVPAPLPSLTEHEQTLLDNMPLYPGMVKTVDPCFICGEVGEVREANWLRLFNYGRAPAFHVCKKLECHALLAIKELQDRVNPSKFLVCLFLIVFDDMFVIVS